MFLYKKRTEKLEKVIQECIAELRVDIDNRRSNEVADILVASLDRLDRKS